MVLVFPFPRPRCFVSDSGVFFFRRVVGTIATRYDRRSKSKIFTQKFVGVGGGGGGDDNGGSVRAQ